MKKRIIIITVIALILAASAVCISVGILGQPDDISSSAVVEKITDENGDSNLLNYIPAPEGYVPEPADPSVMPEYPDYAPPPSQSAD